MNETATSKDIDEGLSVIKDLTEQFDSRFNRVEDELVDLKEEIIILKNSHNRLLNTIDGFIGRIDKYGTELAARDS